MHLPLEPLLLGVAARVALLLRLLNARLRACGTVVAVLLLTPVGRLLEVLAGLLVAAVDQLTA